MADAQLDQPGQPVFSHHSALSVMVVVGAVLQSPCLQQQGFLLLAAMHWDRSGHAQHTASSNWKAGNR